MKIKKMRINASRILSLYFCNIIQIDVVLYITIALKSLKLTLISSKSLFQVKFRREDNISKTFFLNEFDLVCTDYYYYRSL